MFSYGTMEFDFKNNLKIIKKNTKIGPGAAVDLHVFTIHQNVTRLGLRVAGPDEGMFQHFSTKAGQNPQSYLGEYPIWASAMLWRYQFGHGVHCTSDYLSGVNSVCLLQN